MKETDKDIGRAIAGLQALIEQLQTGHLKLLFARAGDAEWSDGAEQMTRYYQQLLTLFETVQADRARIRKLRVRRIRMKREAAAKKAPVKRRL